MNIREKYILEVKIKHMNPLIKLIKEDNLDFIRIAKQSKFTKDAPYLAKKWNSGILEGLFDEDKMLGFMWYNISKRKNYVKLYYVAIDIELRNKGYGRIMMDRLFEISKKSGLSKLTFLVSKENPAIDFYKKFNPSSIEEKDKDYIVGYNLGKKLCIK